LFIFAFKKINGIELMNSQKGIVGCLLLACTLQMSAQVKTYKYRVNFRDKAETTYALDKPSAYLSERALERRMKQGLPVDSTDIPVCRSYIDMLVGKGAQLVSKSKWNNTVVVQVSDTSVIDKVAALPFVTAVRKVWTAPDSIPARNANRKKEVTNRVTKSNNYYGDAWLFLYKFQIAMTGIIGTYITQLCLNPISIGQTSMNATLNQRIQFI
jgi:hypothetical protein